MNILEKIEDKQIEEEIGRRLSKSEVRFPLQVMVKDGYVRLFGYVDTFNLKKEIESIVQSVPGVSIVTNHLRIKPWSV